MTRLELLQLLLLLLAWEEARLVLRLFLTATGVSLEVTLGSLGFLFFFELRDFLLEHRLLGLDRRFDLFFLT